MITTLPQRSGAIKHDKSGGAVQVFMSYGSKANDDLLINYGFVETDNAADTFEFPDLLAWMLQHRPDVINKDRTETLFSKGLQDFVK